ncbi:hypothetical protein, partial [Stenotrophomonas sp. SrG]|uniref:hypothetical protein n=1 Tax=Stenotrophomonas sp. SrG TaxID=3414430 RepID=UPI003CE8F1E6
SAFGLRATTTCLRCRTPAIFGRTPARLGSRQRIADDAQTVALLLEGMSDDRVAYAVEIASIPEHPRGYRHAPAAHLH